MQMVSCRVMYTSLGMVPDTAWCFGPVQVELLLASGASGAAKNSNGNTPMDLAM